MDLSGSARLLVRKIDIFNRLIDVYNRKVTLRDRRLYPAVPIRDRAVHCMSVTHNPAERKSACGIFYFKSRILQISDSRFTLLEGFFELPAQLDTLKLQQPYLFP